jgi:peptide/nickel transport system permease protein
METKLFSLALLGIPNWVSVNLTVVFGFALLGWVLWSGSHHERWQRAWVRFQSDRIGKIALGVVVLYLFIGALELVHIPGGPGGSRSILDMLLGNRIPSEKTYSAPLADTLLTSHDPQPLRGKHLLGTDALGKDVFLQTLKACSTALIIGGLTSAIYIPIGALLGICAGYFRRKVDDAIQYVYSTLASIPEILLLVAIMIVLGKGLWQMSFALGITSWVGLCRLIRGETMRQSERAYITAARALGQSHWNIITRHLLPNVMHLVIINGILGFSGVVLAEAVLSYLGVGSPVGTPSWGNMIDSGRAELSRDPLVWWNVTSAAVALFFLVLALNLLGDALRRAFDPKRS